MNSTRPSTTSTKSEPTARKRNLETDNHDKHFDDSQASNKASFCASGCAPSSKKSKIIHTGLQRSFTMVAHDDETPDMNLSSSKTQPGSVASQDNQTILSHTSKIEGEENDESKKRETDDEEEEEEEEHVQGSDTDGGGLCEEDATFLHDLCAEIDLDMFVRKVKK